MLSTNDFISEFEAKKREESEQTRERDSWKEKGRVLFEQYKSAILPLLEKLPKNFVEFHNNTQNLSFRIMFPQVKDIYLELYFNGEDYYFKKSFPRNRITADLISRKTFEEDLRDFISSGMLMKEKEDALDKKKKEVIDSLHLKSPPKEIIFRNDMFSILKRKFGCN